MTNTIYIMQNVLSWFSNKSTDPRINIPFEQLDMMDK
jgi:hypothetical protein